MIWNGLSRTSFPPSGESVRRAEPALHPPGGPQRGAAAEGGRRVCGGASWFFRVGTAGHSAIKRSTGDWPPPVGRPGCRLSPPTASVTVRPICFSMSGAGTFGSCKSCSGTGAWRPPPDTRISTANAFAAWWPTLICRPPVGRSAWAGWRRKRGDRRHECSGLQRKTQKWRRPGRHQRPYRAGWAPDPSFSGRGNRCRNSEGGRMAAAR